MIKISHRGLMGCAPENTLLSFKKSLNANFQIVELDVYVCKSGELVVIHDEKLNRTSDSSGYVEQFTLSELKNVNAGEGEYIPSLSEVLNLINRKQKVNIELKGIGTAKAVFDIIEHYVDEKSWSYEDFIVSSFNHVELYEFKAMNDKIYLGMLISCIPIDYAKIASDLGVQSINLSLEFISKKFVDDAHTRGLDVFVWTVNYKDDYLKMKELGVDGVFTNYPEFI